MEAMAAGCVVVTSDLGALRETTAGMGHLIPMRPGAAGYGRDFVEKVAGVLQSFANHDSGEFEERVRKQRSYMLSNCTLEQEIGRVGVLA